MKIMRSMLLYILVCSVILTGCQEKEKVPKLVPQISGSELLRPVEKGWVNIEKIYFGEVRPKEDCYFFRQSAKVQKCYVKLGDKVKKGDILVDGGAEQLEKEQAFLKKMLANLKEQSETLEEMFLVQKGFSGTLTAAVKEEYEFQLAKNRIEEKRRKKELSEIKKRIKEERLYAREDGVVTYVKDLSEGRTAQRNENVVIIAEEKISCIETPQLLVSDLQYKNWPHAYVEYKGREYPVQEMEYDSAALSKMKVLEIYAPVRFEIPKGLTLDAGEAVSVFLRKRKNKKSLIVHPDSVFKENGKSFVYVKTPEGGKEKREIFTGEEDVYQIEVKKGLSGNELVYYQSNEMPPAEYETYVVNRTDYEDIKQAACVEKVKGDIYEVNAQEEGKVLSIKRGKIKKGEVLLTFQSRDGKGRIYEAEGKIRQLKREYKEKLQKMDVDIKRGKGKEREYFILKRKLCMLEMEGLLCQAEKEYEDLRERYKRDGTGILRSDYTGEVEQFLVNTGDRIESGSRIAKIRINQDKKICIQEGGEENSSSYIFPNGRRFILSNKSKETQAYGQGICSDGKRAYVTEEKGTCYVTSCNGRVKTSWYVRLKDKGEFENAVFETASYAERRQKDVMVVPRKYVHEEAEKANPAKKYYVWKLEGDLPVKTFVKIYWEKDGGKDVVVARGIVPGDVLVC